MRINLYCRVYSSMLTTNLEPEKYVSREKDSYFAFFNLLSNVLVHEMNPREVVVDRAISYPLISICSTAQVKEAAQMMIRKKGRLAVFECGKLVGDHNCLRPDSGTT